MTLANQFATVRCPGRIGFDHDLAPRKSMPRAARHVVDVEIAGRAFRLDRCGTDR